MSFGGGDVETKLSDVITKNEQLENENALFASYLERVAASTGAEEDDAPEATPTAKKGKSKVVLPKEVALEQKTELAQQEVDDLKDEIELTKAESEKLLVQLQADPPPLVVTTVVAPLPPACAYRHPCVSAG